MAGTGPKGRGEAFVESCSVNWVHKPRSFCADEAAGKYEQLTYSCIWMIVAYLNVTLKIIQHVAMYFLNIDEDNHSCQPQLSQLICSASSVRREGEGRQPEPWQVLAVCLPITHRNASLSRVQANKNFTS